MDLYLFTLGLSFGALLLMSVFGLSRHHSHSHGGHHVHHGHHGHHSAHHSHDARPGAGALWLGLLSPRTFFSLLLGFGATGLILRPLLHESPVLLFTLALIGGWGFETFAVRPLWKLLFGFASAPAQTLDSLASEEGVAATDFDAAGHGLISVRLDGQVRQVLGSLPPGELDAAAPRIRTGDRLLIRTVNRRRNTCTVSRASGLAC